MTYYIYRSDGPLNLFLGTMVAWCKLELTCTFDFKNSFIQIMAKSLIMVKYVREQKYMRAGMKNRKSLNRGLIYIHMFNKENGFIILLFCYAQSIKNSNNLIFI